MVALAVSFDSQLYDQAHSFDMYSCKTTLDFRVRYLAFQHYREIKYRPKSYDAMMEQHAMLREYIGEALYNEIIDLIVRICNARERAYLDMVNNVYYNNGSLQAVRDMPKVMRRILFDTKLLDTFMQIGSASIKLSSSINFTKVLLDLIKDARINLDTFEMWESKIKNNMVQHNYFENC